MNTVSFKNAFAEQSHISDTKLYYGQHVKRNGKWVSSHIMYVLKDDLDRLAEKMKNSVENKVSIGCLPWFTTNE